LRWGGYQSVQRFVRKLPMTAAEELLEIIMRRYERASTLLTSNRPVEDWGKLLGDRPRSAGTGATRRRGVLDGDRLEGELLPASRNVAAGAERANTWHGCNLGFPGSGLY
jgi:hypothetical protein